MKNVIHICGTQSARGSLKWALKEGFLPGTSVMAMVDDLSNGPIGAQIALADRKKWWETLYIEEREELVNVLLQNYELFCNDLKDIGDEDLVIWYGHNGMEMCMLLYMVFLLKGKKNRIYTVNVSDKTYVNDQGYEFTPRWVGELMPERLAELEAAKYELSEAKRSDLEKQWLQFVCEGQEKGLRIFKGHHLTSANVNVLDDYMMSHVPSGFKKCARIVGEILGYNEVPVTDTFVFWRITELIGMEKIDYQGELGIMRKMEIKRGS